jgi:hypothetical protein
MSWLAARIMLLALWPSYVASSTPDIIQLVWGWRSNVMLRYLHLQFIALMRSNLSSTMLQSGEFHLVPSQEVAVTAPLLVEVSTFAE